jgi:type III pantothenate kinase
MYLCIDSGNTQTKCAVYNAQGNIIALQVFDDTSFPSIYEWTQDKNIIHGILSSTGKKHLDSNRFEIPGKWIELSHETPLPIKIIYSTPETLGHDRIAGACGAYALLPGKNCLIIDAGTCMTMDLLLRTGIYLGGNIAPGLQMRLRAMHEQTARLPLAEPAWPDLTFGDSTLHALQNGACLGMIMEIEGLFNRAREAYHQVSIVITGGDSAFLAGRLENQIFVEPELVTQGLFQILSFNVKNIH